jgi:hypothetical protein
MALALVAAGCGGGEPIRLVIESVSPAEGPIGGGQTVVITGRGFLEGSAPPNMVLFGDRLAPSVAGIDDEEIRVVTPPGAPGPVDVVVLNSNGTEVAASAYAYADRPIIEAVEPSSGTFRGGERITITGSGFVDLEAGPPEVSFGDTLENRRLATDVEVVSDREIRVTSPRGVPYSVVNVYVSNRRGVGTGGGDFRYVLRGLLASIGPRNPARLIGQLYGIDTEAGEAIALGTGTANSVALFAMATAPDGTVVGYARSTNTLYEVDPATGDLTVLREVTPPPDAQPFRLNDLEFRGDTLLGLEKTTLVIGTIDLTTGAFTTSGTAHPSHRGEGIASDGSTIWFTGILGNDFQLYTLDLSSGQLSAPVASPTLARTHGTTYLDGGVYVAEVLGEGGGDSRSRIHRIDPASGALSRVADVPGLVHAMTTAP